MCGWFILPRLCYSEWAYCSAYKRKGTDNFSFKRLYLKLDEATVSFNGDYELVRERCRLWGINSEILKIQIS